jgi:tRNA pseudouridine38-40 synthase
MNAQLPPTMRVRRVVAVPPSFHARHSALARVYHYRLCPAEALEPSSARSCYAVRARLVVPWMSEAAGRLEGVHDFAAFGHPVLPGGTTVRRVDSCRVWAVGAAVVCEVAANAFLRHQVRRMVAVLVDVGRGWLRPDAVTAALMGQAGAVVAGRAPAHGLTLTAVEYPSEYEVLWAPVTEAGREAGETR